MEYKIEKGFIVEKIGRKMIVFSGEESTLYSFNGTGSYIFTKIKQGIKNDKIIDELTSEFNVSRKKAKKDFLEFVNVLIKNKIISSLK